MWSSLWEKARTEFNPPPPTLGSPKAHNHSAAWVGRWPLVFLWPHQIFCINCLCIQRKSQKKVFDTVLLDQLLPWAWNWGSAVKESNFQSSHPTQIYQAVLQVKLESGGDEEQVYGDWDQCSRKLWDSRDRAWQFQCTPLFLTPF